MFYCGWYSPIYHIVQDHLLALPQTNDCKKTASSIFIIIIILIIISSKHPMLYDLKWHKYHATIPMTCFLFPWQPNDGDISLISFVTIFSLHHRQSTYIHNRDYCMFRWNLTKVYAHVSGIFVLFRCGLKVPVDLYGYSTGPRQSCYCPSACVLTLSLYSLRSTLSLT